MITNLNKNNKKNKNILAELDQVTKVFTNGEIVLKNLNLKIFKNDFITLLGKSGCGKTTILKILCGLLKPESGEILVDGKQKKSYLAADIFFFYQLIKKQIS